MEEKKKVAIAPVNATSTATAFRVPACLIFERKKFFVGANPLKEGTTLNRYSILIKGSEDSEEAIKFHRRCM